MMNMNSPTVQPEYESGSMDFEAEFEKILNMSDEERRQIEAEGMEELMKFNQQRAQINGQPEVNPYPEIHRQPDGGLIFKNLLKENQPKEIQDSIDSSTTQVFVHPLEMQRLQEQGILYSGDTPQNQQTPPNLAAQMKYGKAPIPYGGLTQSIPQPPTQQPVQQEQPVEQEEDHTGDLLWNPVTPFSEIEEKILSHRGVTFGGPQQNGYYTPDYMQTSYNNFGFGNPSYGNERSVTRLESLVDDCEELPEEPLKWNPVQELEVSLPEPPRVNYTIQYGVYVEQPAPVEVEKPKPVQKKVCAFDEAHYDPYTELLAREPKLRPEHAELTKVIIPQEYCNTPIQYNAYGNTFGTTNTFGGTFQNAQPQFNGFAVTQNYYNQQVGMNGYNSGIQTFNPAAQHPVQHLTPIPKPQSQYQNTVQNANLTPTNTLQNKKPMGLKINGTPIEQIDPNVIRKQQRNAEFAQFNSSRPGVVKATQPTPATKTTTKYTVPGFNPSGSDMMIDETYLKKYQEYDNEFRKEVSELYDSQYGYWYAVNGTVPYNISQKYKKLLDDLNADSRRRKIEFNKNRARIAYRFTHNGEDPSEEYLNSIYEPREETVTQEYSELNQTQQICNVLDTYVETPYNRSRNWYQAVDIYATLEHDKIMGIKRDWKTGEVISDNSNKLENGGLYLKHAASQKEEIKNNNMSTRSLDRTTAIFNMYNNIENQGDDLDAAVKWSTRHRPVKFASQSSGSRIIDELTRIKEERDAMKASSEQQYNNNRGVMMNTIFQ